VNEVETSAARTEGREDDLTVGTGGPSGMREGAEMPFAAVTTVNLEGRDRAGAEMFLHKVLLPKVRVLPGFRTARFLRSLDGKRGVGSVVFDTEANTMSGLDAMITDLPPEAPPIENTAFYEVIVDEILEI
jgi:hypothetical protein